MICIIVCTDCQQLIRMTLRKIFFAHDHRFRIIWRLLIFISLLAITTSPLILIKNAVLQFLGATLVLISGLYLNARYLDKRPLSIYGIRFKGISLNFFMVGILIGSFSVCFILVLGILGGTLSISESQTNPDLKVLLLFGLKMIMVAIIEETLYRGYFFTNLYAGFQSKTGIHNLALVGAIVISSIIFGLAHFSNHNASVVSMSFLTVNGIVWCIPFILTNNLGLSIGLHASWNFCQSLLGFTMSGNKAENSIFNIHNTGDQIWTGGDSGPEAGLLGLGGYMLMLLLTLAYLKII